ncbi:Hsp20/alpha crystallin family protein [Candidatus Uhrbacteria bacterium]|nr:Hsp20/alpha crystallin family protein [Candidatus Uhrbacteria bacterium]
MSNTPKQSAKSFLDSQWLSTPEGQLAIDVHETPTHLIVRSAIAGIQAKDIEITLTDDTLTIRGQRHHEQKEMRGQTTHVQECHWGAFSRSIILPAHVDPDRVEATLKRGIITITLQKIESDRRVPIIDLGDV